ncbi:hypothetical protein [Gracilibacillus sp. Marseille-QA3620]
MIIELLGIPGSGKSTFADNLMKENINFSNPLTLYLYNESRYKQNINKLKLFAGFLLNDPKELLVISGLFKKIKFKKRSTKLKMYLYLFSIIAVINKCQKKDINGNYVLDEGINQVIWGITYNSYSSGKEIDELHVRLSPYFANQIICIKVSKELVKERLYKRKGSGGSELQNDIKKNEVFLDHSIYIHENVINRVKQINSSILENRITLREL